MSTGTKYEGQEVKSINKINECILDFLILTAIW